MKTQSNIRPNTVKVNNLGNGQAEILISANIAEVDNEQEGYIGYKYDLYIINAPYRDNLYESVMQNLEAWTELAKQKENEVIYTDKQLLEQRLTDIELNCIEQGQMMTELELKILEG